MAPETERRRDDFLLEEMRRMHSEHREDQKALAAAVGDLRVDVGSLKVKAGVWGAMAGVVPVALAGAFIAIKSMLARH